MPVSLKKIRETGAITIHGKCEVCGKDASFYIGMHLRRAFIALDKGEKEKCKQLLGKAYCGEHVKEFSR